jgi:toluene monooxygenase system protein A
VSLSIREQPAQESLGTSRIAGAGHMLSRDEWLPLARKLDWDYSYDSVWDRVIDCWKAIGPGAENEAAVHGAALPGFCDLCQLPLSGGSPRKNTANVLAVDRRKYIFCSEPCRWIFQREPERYANHTDVVKRVLSGEAPAQLSELLTEYFRLTPDTWGRDVYHGDYDWLRKASVT